MACRREERGVHADADRERACRGEREGAVPNEQPNRESDVLTERVDNRQASLVAIDLFDRYDPAQCAPCGDVGVLPGHTATGVVVGQQIGDAPQSPR